MKRILAALAVFAVLSTGAFGASLDSIGVLTPTAGGTTVSWVSAISADGTYAVGYSNAPNNAGTSTINQPVIWSKATGLVQLPNASDAAFLARGVVVRPNAGKIALSGSPGSGTLTMNTYEAPLTNLASGTWTAASYGTAGPITMAASSVQFNASRLDASSGTADSWYVAGAYKSTTSSTTNGFRYGVDGSTSQEYQSYKFAAGYYVTGYAVSGNGYMAGSDRGNQGTSKKQRAIRLDTPGAGMVDPPTTSQTVIPGGNSKQSEALGISVNGLKLCGYDYDSTGTNPKAFAWTVNGGSMTILPQYGSDTASQAFVINNAGVTGGYSTDGTNMKAIIWDTTGTWDTTGQAKTVRDLLTTAGISVDSNWQALTRVTSMSDDGKTIAGTGKWIDGTTRGWVATIPEPASVLLLTLGGLSLLRRRRA